MENYDPEFSKIAKNGDIVAGGFNFGTGSSREQAATALKHKGLQLVIAGSFSETYKRNAINNGFLIIECPELVKDLQKQFGTVKLSVKTEIEAEIDFKSSAIKSNNILYPFPPVGMVAQELIICGGLENWVKKQRFPWRRARITKGFESSTTWLRKAQKSLTGCSRPRLNIACYCGRTMQICDLWILGDSLVLYPTICTVDSR